MILPKPSLQSHKKDHDRSWLLFLLAAVLSVITTYYVSAHYIDSDTSSELVLARHWIETKHILSEDWLYGSEIRLLHVQLIYVPLMLLLENWLLVRYFGALIMQALFLLSFACLVHAAGKDQRFFFRGAAMLLLPVSVSYGRIVLYHNHYLPNITISFFLIAISLYFTREVNWSSKKTWIHLLLLAMFSFAGGLNSIRQLMITHTPLLLIAVVLCWIEDARNDDCSKSAFLRTTNQNFLFCCIYGTAFSLLGLKAQGYLCSRLGLRIGIQSENNTLSLLDSEYLNDLLYGFFHQFGYRNYVPMLSITGILALGGIFTGCYLLFMSVTRLLQSKPSQDRRQTVLSVFFLAYTVVMTLVFLVTRGSEPLYYYPLYLSLCFPWAVPLVLCNLEDLPVSLHPLRMKKLFAIVTVILLLLSGTVNILYFQGSERFPQIYEGLGFQDRDKKAELTEVVTYLTEQGYDKGYACHWESNIVTEMTNGQMPMVTLFFIDNGQSGNLLYAEYLYQLWLKESPCEKPFLLITEEMAAPFLNSDSSAYCTEIYSGHGHLAYSIDNLEAFIKTLHS